MEERSSFLTTSAIVFGNNIDDVLCPNINRPIVEIATPIITSTILGYAILIDRFCEEDHLVR